MQVKVVRYVPTARQRVQAFVDIEIGPYRVNGLHFERRATLRSAQLTPTLGGRIRFIPSIEILDRPLEERLTKEILKAIHDHIETLPMDQRLLPPRPPRKPDEPPAAAPVSAKPAADPEQDLARWNLLVRLISQRETKPARPENGKAPGEKPKVLPPLRLLANIPRRTR